uniref:Regulator of telomere elongation helicase 1 homolog n=1 Tax=Palpitomonas bilix TaxID=652834 RepID=A0A7S3DGD9_9EUKA|mmetsp:Transcript_36031/g.93741  ORF Transcript_36031/g.93741 Transcript_36031/m.93741 type:complete len:792 (+) Transcript_36031:33-2408(+)
MAEEGPTGAEYTIAGVKVQFPLRAYPCQISVMERVITSASRGENALLESPTGTGKTLALLASSIAWMNSRNQQYSSYESPQDSLNSAPVQRHRIFYATRTHSQLAQVVDELKRVKGTFKSSMLAAREHLCVFDRDLFGEGVTVDEGCVQALEDKNCYFFHKSEKVVEEVKPFVWDIEDIVTVGRKVGGCPFYASRDLAKEADVLLCPYNYLIDPVIRNTMSISIDSALVIFDEAHNIEDMCRDALSLNTTRAAIRNIATECANLGKRGVLPEHHFGIRNMMMNVASLMGDAESLLEKTSFMASERKYATKGAQLLKMFDAVKIRQENVSAFSTHVSEAAELVRVIQNEKKSGRLMEHPILSFRKRPDFRQFDGPQCLSIRTLTSLERIEIVLRYFFSIPNDFCFVLTQVAKRRGRRAVDDLSMGIWCLNPALAFREISSQSHSVVLASGTLSPMDTFSSELGCEFPKKLEARHVIGNDQVQCLCLPKGVKGRSLTSSFRAGGDISMLDDLGETLVGLVRAVPHGMLFFFPSYKKLETILSRWEENGIYKRIEESKEIFFEPRRSHEFDAAIQGYYERIAYSVRGESKGAIMFAVFRGKVSEGIDFSDAKARAVVCYGIPFPNVKEEGVAKKKEYNDSEKGAGRLSGAEWYRQQAFRALNQALGRCIRHRNDFGAIILLEERMTEPGSTYSLSKWLRDRVQVWNSAREALDYLSRYFEARKKDEPPVSPPARQAETSWVQQIAGKSDQKKRKRDKRQGRNVINPLRNSRKLKVETEEMKKGRSQDDDFQDLV